MMFVLRIAARRNFFRDLVIEIVVGILGLPIAERHAQIWCNSAPSI